MSPKSQHTMGALSWFFGSVSRRCRSYYVSLLEDFHKTPPVVQTHLKRVLLARCGVMIAISVGACFHIFWKVGGLPTFYAFLATKLWFLSTHPNKERMKVSLLMISEVFYGASLLHLHHYLFFQGKTSVFVAHFLGPTLGCGCFARAISFPRRREYLFLGGLLSFGVSVLLLLHFPSCIIDCSTALSMIEFSMHYILALLLYLVFMVWGILRIIEKANSGDLDYNALDYLRTWNCE